ncbi:isoprenylcysteine carboxylmethyltransferase family protein [bacterium]|nr:isoprenylcysteine carboxylmethyltransferase family protein [bacterium]
MVVNDDTEATGRDGSSRRRSARRRVLRVVMSAVCFPGVLFLSAGRFNWFEAWAFLFFFFTCCLVLRMWMRRHDPALMDERLSVAPDVERWDKVLMGVYTVLLLMMLVVAALDAGRFKWSSTPLSVRALGWFGLGAALVIVWWAMGSNPFASRLVRIQHDRGHTVATGGPYRHVRHPMYGAGIIFCMCVPVVLGSWWGVLPSIGIAMLFVLRTVLEDRTLTARLPGYREYVDRVRYRLLPGVW